MRQNTPIGVFSNIRSIILDIENRIIRDFSIFEFSEFYDKEPYPLDDYLDLRILKVEKDRIAWVAIDFVYNEIDVVDFLNADSSGIIEKIEDYNSRFLI